MALGFKASVANSLNDAALRAGTFTGAATLFIELHTAAPGAAGTTAVAGNSTRKAIAFNASSGGVSASTSDVTWTSVSTSETYTHFAIWDAVSAGNFIGSGTITANAVTSGDNFTITAGTATLTLLTAS
jgi:hypothetical protein